jgi:repressor LexA
MADDGQYLGRLRDYYARHRVLPSYSRIGTLVGLSSKASVAEMVLRLKAEGFLESSPDRRLKPGRRFFERTLAEGVRAGLPTPAPDIAVPDTVTIDERLIPNPSKTVLIKVKGDSMIDAGIHDGDLVVVRRQQEARDRDIVAALIDDEEATVKRLQRRDGRVILISENPAYAPMVFTEGVQILGKVVAVLRSLL